MACAVEVCAKPAEAKIISKDKDKTQGGRFLVAAQSLRSTRDLRVLATSLPLTGGAELPHELRM